MRAQEAARRRRELDAFEGEQIPICADAEALPCGDGSIDLVLVANGLHHFLDPAKGLPKPYRVVRPGVVVIEALIARLAKRFLVPSLHEVPDSATRLATLGPRLLTKHLAVVAEKKKRYGGKTAR